MSLTSFLEDNADVRERFLQEFKKPEPIAKKELVAPPLTTRYSTVGIAFDYLLRFFIQHLNPHTIDRGYWVAEKAVERLAYDPKVYSKGEKIVSRARKDLASFLKKGQMSDALIESALLLATLDPIFRAGVGHEMIGVVHKDDVQDLKNLISAVDERLFVAKNLCVINPTFGSASVLVGGADADLVVDDTIIDIKTTKKLSLDRSTLDQVLGYYVLHHISGVGELNPKPMINKVAIYFSRYGYLHVVHLSGLVDSATFPKFVRWFQKRAAEAFPSVVARAGARKAPS
jgi:hypothetical protein